MRLLLFGLAPCVLVFSGCGTQAYIPSGLVADSGTFAPSAYKDGREADPKQYSADRDLCFKQVQAQTDLAMTESTNITKFRKCLVSRGYVLLG